MDVKFIAKNPAKVSQNFAQLNFRKKQNKREKKIHPVFVYIHIYKKSQDDDEFKAKIH